jgi:hypothetical protein
LNRDALQFGHPACNIVCPLFVVSLGDRHEIVECVPEGDPRGVALMGRLLDAVGGLDPLGSDPIRGILRLSSVIARHPGLLASAGLYGLARAWRERRLVGSIVAALGKFRGVRIRPWILVVHGFMDRDELSTPLGRERMDACVFRPAARDGCDDDAASGRIEGERDMREWLRLASSPSVVRRALGYAVVVGAILIGINHGDALLRADIDAGRIVRMALTTLVPYLVSTFSSVGAIRAARPGGAD